MILLFLAVCGGIGCAIRAPKGDPAGGFLAGLILGPLGVVLAIAWPVRGRKCPYCAESVKPEAIVCRHCGRDLAVKA